MGEPGEISSPLRRQWMALVFFVLVCGLAALYASLYAPSASGVWGWYPKLQKPAWAPEPAWTGQVSAAYYAVLAVSMWRVWRTGAFRNVPITMAGFGAVLFLQAIWSTLFYGMHNPLLGFADLAVIALLGSVLWLTYRQLDPLAGWLWLAYLAWLGVLLAVNGAIWWLNG